MKNFIKKFFFNSNNLDYISRDIRDLTINTPANRIFEAINIYSDESEIRYVGGCIRKIIVKEEVDDIDFATNLEPEQVCDALRKKKINYHETGKEHGTITALIEKYKFEITSLREDISTDGRHAKVRFSKNWKEDASRRDFTINSIYSDKDGNIFDPFEGKKDLEAGYIHFIGDPDKRIKEDYLRILRYLRFFLNYSNHPHNPKTISKIKMNIGGISRLSKERLLNELKKMAKLEIFEKLSNDKVSLELISIIFPELKNFNIFLRLDLSKKNILKEKDFIFLLSLMIIGEKDNVDYFLYKFNISKKNQKRIRIIENFYKEKVNSKTFTEKNINKLFYYDGRQAVLDILNFKIIKSKKLDKNLKQLSEIYKIKAIPKIPIDASVLMTKYHIPEGKELGTKLKMIEEEWIKNDFKISEKQIHTIVEN